MKVESLKRQLEISRFDRGLEVAESLAERRALLTTAELARLNNIVTGQTTEPWRRESTSVTLPSGTIETFGLIVDPVLLAREKLHRATEIAEGGSAIDAGVAIYIDLVLAHVFTQGNRRTAVLASHYFFKRYNAQISGIVLYELGVGNLRQPGQIEALKEIILEVAKFTNKRK